VLAILFAHDHNPLQYMAYRSVNFISNGFGAPVNYHVPGPLGTQFASPFGDPYRVQGTAGLTDFLSSAWKGLTGLVGSVGKIAAPVLPGLAQVGVSTLLTPKTTAQTQQPSQSQFTQVTGQTQAQLDAAAAEKSNTVIYVAVGAVALFAAYYFISKRRR
jgi:hypothetical protein